MDIALGFGKTETDFEEQEIKFVEDFLAENFLTSSKASSDFLFDNVLIKKLDKKLSKRAAYYRVLSEKYKTAIVYPDRYSTYYFDILSDAVNLCIVFKFSHTNRKHPLSPDGWALLQTKKAYYTDIWDFIDN